MSSRDGLSTHIDKLVVYLFIGAFLISASTLAFRYAKYAPCQEVYFEHNAQDTRAGQMVQFKSQSEGAEEWKWDFGDSTALNSDKDPYHIFYKEGEFKVRLLVNNICEKIETVTIKPELILRDPTKIPIFTLPDYVEVGEKLNVIDETANALSWEWRFGETTTVDATTKEAQYSYENPGIKTVTLIVNGDYGYKTHKDITVTSAAKIEDFVIDDIEETPERDKRLELNKAPDTEPVKLSDKPDMGEEPKKVVPYITEAEFRSKVEQIANEKITAGTLAKFLCGNINIPVIARGKPTTFLAFCENIKGKKIRKIKVELFREDGSNCITNIAIDYKKSLL